MRFGHGSQSRYPMWVTANLLVAAVILPDSALWVAQDGSVTTQRSMPSPDQAMANEVQRHWQLSDDTLPNVYSSKSYSVGKALAKLESTGHSSENARRDLLDRMPSGDDGIRTMPDAEILSSVKLVDDRLYVTGTRAYLKLVEERLASIETFGSTQLRYTIRIIETPAEQAKQLTKGWRMLGRSESLATNEPHASAQSRPLVIPASSTSTAKTYEFLMSSVLSDEQVMKLVRSGNMISAPKLIGHNGSTVEVRVGEEIPFLTSYEPATDPNTNASTAMQPITTVLFDGISLELSGTIKSSKECVRLTLNFEQSDVERMFDTFTFQSQNGPLTVQQPGFSSRAIQTYPAMQQSAKP